jgi:hypothetical protein
MMKKSFVLKIGDNFSRLGEPRAVTLLGIARFLPTATGLYVPSLAGAMLRRRVGPFTLASHDTLTSGAC